MVDSLLMIRARDYSVIAAAEGIKALDGVLSGGSLL
jgi:hypothetical protein